MTNCCFNADNFSLFCFWQNDGLQDVVHAVVPVPSFIEDHSDLIKRQQRSVSVGIESKCNESQLVAQLEVHRLGI